MIINTDKLRAAVPAGSEYKTDIACIEYLEKMNYNYLHECVVVLEEDSWGREVRVLQRQIKPPKIDREAIREMAVNIAKRAINRYLLGFSRQEEKKPVGKRTSEAGCYSKMLEYCERTSPSAILKDEAEQWNDFVEEIIEARENELIREED